MGVLKKPMVTEKYTALGEKYGHYGFIVEKRATKEEIRKEIELLYDVKVASIRTMVYAGKTVTRYTNKNFIHGKKNGFKKAIVKLNEGNQIDFYSNI
ncbi:MAG: 50S ribosomal protein L23 [Flavobacterium sp.]|nr:MAG: 50S ribosomal protein L23 [Flavobacterium sp.]